MSPGEYFHDYKIREKHIQQHDLPFSTKKHLEYGNDPMYGDGYRVTIICFDPKDLESVKKKYANENVQWEECSDTCIDNATIYNAELLIRRHLPAHLKELYPNHQGWNAKTLYSIYGTTRFLDTERGILWEVR